MAEEAEDLSADVLPPDDAAADEAPLSEVDELAVELGWRPKSEWKGDESDWTDSKTFLRKTKEIGKSTAKELRDLRKQVDGIGKATAGMTARAVEAERNRIMALRDEAFDVGDKDGYKALDQQLAKLATPKTEVDDAAKDFAKRHSSWFEKDDEATGYAFVRATYWQNKGVTDPAEQLQRVEQDVQKRFPELFEDKPTRKPPPALAAPQRQVATQSREKGVTTLPPDARKAMKGHVSNQAEQYGWDAKRIAKEEAAWAGYYYEQEAANG